MAGEAHTHAPNLLTTTHNQTPHLRRTVRGVEGGKSGRGARRVKAGRGVDVGEEEVSTRGRKGTSGRPGTVSTITQTLIPPATTSKVDRSASPAPREQHRGPHGATRDSKTPRLKDLRDVPNARAQLL